jgi:hypothetical protein
VKRHGEMILPTINSPVALKRNWIPLIVAVKLRHIRRGMRLYRSKIVGAVRNDWVLHWTGRARLYSFFAVAPMRLRWSLVSAANVRRAWFCKAR